MEKAREFQKNIYFCFLDYAKAFDYPDHNKLENSERDGNTRPPYLPPEKSVCRLRSNSQYGTWNNRTGSEWRKKYVKAVYCHPAYLTQVEYIKQNAGLDESQAEIKTAGRNINNLRYTDDTTLMAEKKN